MYNTVYFRVLILFLTGPFSLKYNYLSISLMSSIKNRTSRLCILCLFCIYFLQRLKRQAETRLSQLQKQPDLPFTLKEWATTVGASERTLSRLCSKEFPQSFSQWRQNIRLVLSLQLLSSKMSIQEIAIESGYSSDSAYVQAFKKLFNQTPRKYQTVNL